MRLVTLQETGAQVAEGAHMQYSHIRSRAIYRGSISFVASTQRQSRRWYDSRWREQDSAGGRCWTHIWIGERKSG